MTDNPSLKPALTLLKVDSAAFGQYPAYFQARVKALAAALAAGKITVDEWLEAMTEEIDHLHHAAYMTGVGGPDKITSDNLAKIAVIVAAQVAFLTKWAKQLTDGGEINAGAIETRAGMYLQSATPTIMEAQVESLGIPPLPFYPKIGTICHSNCGCDWEIEQLDGNGNFDCYWRRSKDDSCETCIAREGACSPLKVRDGVVQPFNDAGTIAD